MEGLVPGRCVGRRCTRYGNGKRVKGRRNVFFGRAGSTCNYFVFVPHTLSHERLYAMGVDSFKVSDRDAGRARRSSQVLWGRSSCETLGERKASGCYSEYRYYHQYNVPLCYKDSCADNALTSFLLRCETLLAQLHPSPKACLI